MEAEDTMKNVNELQRLAQIAERPHVKQLLETEIQRLLSTVTASRSNDASTQSSAAATATAPTTTTTKTRDTKAFASPIKTYAWDQTSSAVKIYVTLDGVGALPKDQIRVDFKDSSFSLAVENLNNKNHTLSVNLFEDIDPEKSSFKIRKTSVQLSLSKRSSGSWSHLTAKERSAEDKKKSKFSPPAADSNPEDPSGNLMGMLKKMYDEGDDEMKRTLSKAWTESQDKQAKGEFGSA